MWAQVQRDILGATPREGVELLLALRQSSPAPVVAQIHPTKGDVMVILLVVYLIVGFIFANHKVNNPDISVRPQWASNSSLPFLFRLFGFVGFAILWPLIMLTAPRRR